MGMGGHDGLMTEVGTPKRFARELAVPLVPNRSKFAGSVVETLCPSPEHSPLWPGWPVRDNLSATEFWNAARAGQAETWLDKSFTKELGPARPHPEETEVPDREDGEFAPPDPDGRLRHG
jgi:hypothetical protein